MLAEWTFDTGTHVRRRYLVVSGAVCAKVLESLLLCGALFRQFVFVFCRVTDRQRTQKTKSDYRSFHGLGPVSYASVLLYMADVT